ncbi:MAG: hypothetical protein ACK4S0_09225 [Sediminibacterium sp.]
MKVIMIFFQIFFLLQDTVYKQKQYGGYTLYYSYVKELNAIYLLGYISDNKSGQPINDVNIFDEKTLEGTVPNSNDEKHRFKLQLVEKTGRVIFDKPGVFRFYHAYMLD